MPLCTHTGKVSTVHKRVSAQLSSAMHETASQRDADELTVTLVVEHAMPFISTKAELDRFFCRSLVKPRRRVSVRLLCLPRRYEG